MTDTPKTFGQWHLVSEDALFVVVACQCGTTKSIRKSTWRAANHLSRKCQACFLRDAEAVHGWIFNKPPKKARNHAASLRAIPPTHD